MIIKKKKKEEKNEKREKMSNSGLCGPGRPETENKRKRKER